MNFPTYFADYNLPFDNDHMGQHNVYISFYARLVSVPFCNPVIFIYLNDIAFSTLSRVKDLEAMNRDMENLAAEWYKDKLGIEVSTDKEAKDYQTKSDYTLN